MSLSLMQYGTLAIWVCQLAFFVIIKFNDVSHLHKEVNRLGKECKATKDNQNQMNERLARMEGKIDLLVDKFVPTTEPKKNKA